MDILLGQYKGLKATIPYIAYTDDDINSQIATPVSYTHLTLPTKRIV